MDKMVVIMGFDCMRMLVLEWTFLFFSVKELKERLAKLAVDEDGMDPSDLKRQNEDLREQLRAVELSHNENDRAHRASIARYSDRAVLAEVSPDMNTGG